MAVTQTQQLPAPFLQDVTKDYATRLGATTAPATTAGATKLKEGSSNAKK